MNRSVRSFEPFVEPGHQEIYGGRSMSVVLPCRVSSHRATRAGLAATQARAARAPRPGRGAARVRCLSSMRVPRGSIVPAGPA